MTAMMKNPHLEGDDFYWPGNETGILLIHGYTATTAEVRLIAEKLHQDGFTTAAPCLPGHGTHPDEMNTVTWHDWLEKAEAMFQKLQENCHIIFLIAESMGTLLALELAADHPEIAGLMLFAPAIKIAGLWRARILSLVMTHLPKNASDDGLPWKGYTVYPLKGLVEMLKLQKHVEKRLPEINQPTLVFTGAHDQTIHPDAHKIILNKIAAGDKTHIHMKESPHCILLDHELDQAYARVKTFITKISRQTQ